MRKATDVFCPECRQVCGYTVKQGTGRAMKDGLPFEFPTWEACCDKCGAEICVSEVSDKNLAAYIEARNKQ